jgi:hypothetical protein
VSNYEACYNYVLEHANGTSFDMHGGNDVSKSSVPAGGTITIHHNTFEETGPTPVNIRGVPANGAKVYANWVKYGSESIVKQIFYQALNNLGLKPYVKMSVYDNWYGTASPPTTTSGATTPVAPAPPPIAVAPTLSSPADGANVSGTSVTFRWNDSPGATKYFLIVSTNPSLTVAQSTSSVRKYWGQLGNVTQYTVTGFRNNGTTYYWWVWTGNAHGWCSQAQVVANGGWGFTNRP